MELGKQTLAQQAEQANLTRAQQAEQANLTRADARKRDYISQLMDQAKTASGQATQAIQYGGQRGVAPPLALVKAPSAPLRQALASMESIMRETGLPQSVMPVPKAPQPAGYEPGPPRPDAEAPVPEYA